MAHKTSEMIEKYKPKNPANPNQILQRRKIIPVKILLIKIFIMITILIIIITIYYPYHLVVYH